MKTVKASLSFYRMIILVFVISSTLAGFFCAYLSDFYPKMEGIAFWLGIKAVIGTCVSFWAAVEYFALLKKAMEDKT